MHCRLAVIKNIQRSPTLVHGIIDALKSAAENDPYARPLGFTKHADGWGFVAADREKGSLHFYKTSKPIWLDETSPGTEYFLYIVHARKASTGMPLGVQAAHPYVVGVGDGSLLAVAQNGGVKAHIVSSILDDMGVAHPRAGRVTDTYLYAVALASMLSSSDSLSQAIDRLDRMLEEKGATGRCMNTAALIISPGDEMELAVTRRIYSDDSRLVDYCELFAVEGEGVEAVVSSTVVRYLEEIDPSIDVAPLSENTVFTLYP